MKQETQVHPADILAKALDRANGLLTAIGQLYDADQESFSGGNPFVAMSIATSIELISNAHVALDNLQMGCDLSLINHPATNDIVLEMNFPSETALRHEEPVQESLPVVETSAEVATYVESPAVEQEKIAQSYLELLQKLTAAEVFAVEQQALSVPGSSPELLPLLRSLREDLEKIHAAA